MNRELSLLGLASKAGKLAIGDEAVSDVIRHGVARLIIVAWDAAPNTKRRFEVDPGEYHCKRVEIPATKAELGGALGRSTCAVCALCDIGFAASFLRILSASHPEDAELRMLYERMNGRADEINAARREKRREERALERAKAKPWSPPPAKKQSAVGATIGRPPKPDSDRPAKNGSSRPVGADAHIRPSKPDSGRPPKNAFSYKKVYGKPGPVRGADGKARAYEKGDARHVGADAHIRPSQNTSRPPKNGDKPRGKGGFARAGSFIGKNNGGYKPYYGEGTKKSKG